MLCLSRRIGQAIVIGNVTIKVMNIKHGQVRLAFDAPKDVEIWREELHKAVAPPVTPGFDKLAELNQDEGQSSGG